MQQVKIYCCVEFVLNIHIFRNPLSPFPLKHLEILRILANVHTVLNLFKHNWYSCRVHNDLGDLGLLILIQALLTLLISVTHLPTLQHFMAFSCYVFHDHPWHWDCLYVWWYAADISDFKFILCFTSSPAFCGLVVNNPPVNAEDARNMFSNPGSGRPLGVENGNPLQYSCLENSMDRETWQVTVHGITKSWTWLSKWTHRHTYIPVFCGSYSQVYLLHTSSPLPRKTQMS